MSNDFLIEIGCEELPSKVMKQLAAAFKKSIEAGFKKEELSFETIDVFVSPRHLAVKATSLSKQQKNKKVIRKGPSKKSAFNENGEPTQALLGFMKSCQAKLEQLTTVVEKKGEWLVFESHQEGQLTSSLLPSIVNDAIKKLPIPKPMRWGSSNIQFARPVHWVILMFGCEVIPATVLGLQTGRITYGHRFHYPQEIRLADVSEYESSLEKAFVIVDFNKRKKLISDKINTCAKNASGQLINDPDLLDEVTTIVEWPTAVLVPFDNDFLTVPKEALISSMASHQKCFSLQDNDKDLLPYFITVSNIEPTCMENIILGNERVMRARLSDAKFFYDNDKKTTLSDKNLILKNVVFQNKLGSIQDKVERVSMLAKSISENFSANTKVTTRVATLSKASLVTEMVGEFPSLQDVMGYYYALHDGESHEVAIGLKEYYLPRYSGDMLPSSQEGAVVAIADRLDTLVGIFGINQKPTGVKDPFQLRRLSLAVIRILMSGNYNVSLEYLLKQSLATFKVDLPNDNIKEDLKQFFIDRFSVYAVEQLNLRADVVKAVLKEAIALSFSDVLKRCESLQQFVITKDSEDLIQGFKRVGNLLKQEDIDQLKAKDVDESLLEEVHEKSLFQSIQTQRDKISLLMNKKNYDEVLHALSSLKQPVDDFFQQVRVNVDDMNLKHNRLIMLAQLESLFSQFASLSLIQGN